tara:strand:- start:72 stop:389 length:318 start_codon:yes stop_codon:yes gene_type:complete
MIVELYNKYLKLQDVIDMFTEGKKFSIYRTHKGTNILITDTTRDYEFEVYYPKQDRLPYKVLEGKKLVTCVENIFCSDINYIEDLDPSTWNNGEQIMSYDPKDHF